MSSLDYIPPNPHRVCLPVWCYVQICVMVLHICWWHWIGQLTKLLINRRFFTAKHGSRIFFESGTTGKKLPWSYDDQLFKRWRDGKTGMPLVDANMRELKQTGALLFGFSRLIALSTLRSCMWPHELRMSVAE